MTVIKMLQRLLGGVVLSALGFALSATAVMAGTNLSASCPAIGVCSVSPAGMPLLSETMWAPGTSVTQTFTVSNTSSQNGFVAVQAINFVQTKGISSVIDVEIRRGSAVGPIVYGGVTLEEFKNDGYFTIDAISAAQSTVYYFKATMHPLAGNEYQGATVSFDLRLGLEVAPIVPSSGGGNGSGGSGTGGTSAATPPVCSDQVPSAAPSLQVTSVGTNTVSLSWSPVSPVSHYALVFNRNSDGAAYGSANIGNVTTFTVQNLSGGASYTFEVFGVNGCAPGPRSNRVNTGNVPGPFLSGRPTGGGQVLGTTATASPSPVASPQPSPSPAGQVAGASSECAVWKIYVPWILLVIQLLFLVFVEFYFRKDQGYTKYYLVVGMTILSLVLFYLLRNCPCYEAGAWWFLVWLCKWYWLVALLITGLVRLFSYAFIEEVEEQVTTKATPVIP